MHDGSIDLSGVWSLADVNGDHKVAFALPGDGISALQSGGAIPDPYFGRNEYDLRWISERDWIATRRFVAGSGAFELVIDELDTVADISINGRKVGFVDNAYRRYRFDVSKALKAGDNETNNNDGDDDREKARPQHGNQQDRKQYGRKSHPDIDQAADHPIHPSAQKSGKQAKRRPEQRRCNPRQQGHGQCNPCAMDDPAQHIPAK